MQWSTSAELSMQKRQPSVAPSTHDVGEVGGAAKHVRRRSKPNMTWCINAPPRKNSDVHDSFYGLMGLVAKDYDACSTCMSWADCVQLLCDCFLDAVLALLVVFHPIGETVV